MVHRAESLCLRSGATIREAVSVIDRDNSKIALVVDVSGRLIGTITDGDIRRGLLRGLSLESSADEVMFRDPFHVHARERGPHLFDMMRERDIRQIPLVDDDGRVVDLVLFGDFLLPDPTDTLVVVMAGGEGRRLRPLTDTIPKPMLRVGSRPILETILSNFIRQGLTNFVLAVNYQAHVIKDHFGDGRRHGGRIRYIEEAEPLGTAGPLRLLPERPTKPLIVINGDVLTTLDYRRLLGFHSETGARITIGAHRHERTVPFGVLDIDVDRVVAIHEKPVFTHFINSGIYVIDPAALDLLPASGPFDMPRLVDATLAGGYPVRAFPICEYWLDVGRMDDFQRACRDFDGVFGSGDV